jgi:opacity protein-like surface antigen
MRSVAACALAGLIAISIGVLARPARAEWILDAEGGLVYESNLNRTARHAGRVDDVAFAGSLAAGHYLQLTDATSLTATLDLAGALYTEFERLDNIAAGITAATRHKLGLGGLAPWLRLRGSAAYQEYHEDRRDGLIVTAGLEVGKRFHERFDGRIGYVFEHRDAEHRVWDQDSHSLALTGNVLLTPALELTLRYAVRWGPVVVHAEPGTAGAGPAVGVETFDRPQIARRIDATTHVAAAGLSYALTGHVALDAGYEYEIAFGKIRSYPNHVVRASVRYSF